MKSVAMILSPLRNLEVVSPGKVLAHSCKIGVVKGVDTPRTLSQSISSGALI